MQLTVIAQGNPGAGHFDPPPGTTVDLANQRFCRSDPPVKFLPESALGGCRNRTVRTAKILGVTEETWRPMGIETDEEIATYDALHDEIPSWMWSPYWAWIRSAITVRRLTSSRNSVNMLDVELVEQMCQTLQIPLSNHRSDFASHDRGKAQLAGAIKELVAHPFPLQIADYIAAFKPGAKVEELRALLDRSKSAWTVGERAGRPGLVRVVPLGVQRAVDSVMRSAGRAGVHLAKAWEHLYGLTPDASAAYLSAIKAVEDAAIPVVSPKNGAATLGTVLKQMEDQRDWHLPLSREHDRAPSSEVVVAMLRILWHGQHDRHGGQPSAPGNVSLDEATAAVSLAVTLVNWFASGLVTRRAS